MVVAAGTAAAAMRCNPPASPAQSALVPFESFLPGSSSRRLPSHRLFLCDDSLWFVEALRGNKYKVVHVYMFASTSNFEAVIGGDGAAASPAGGGNFTVSDSEVSIELRAQVS